MGDRRLVEAGGGGQGAGDQLAGDADPEGAGDQLVPDEGLPLVEAAPDLEDRLPLVFALHAAEGEQALFDPAVQGEVAVEVFVALRFVLRRAGEEGHGLRQVADGVAALLQQPVRDARRLRRPEAEVGVADEALGAVAGEEVDGPGGVVGGRFPEVGFQGRQLAGGLGGGVEGGVEGGESLQLGFPLSPSSAAAGASSASVSVSSRVSPSKRVSIAFASRPFSSRR